MFEFGDRKRFAIMSEWSIVALVAVIGTIVAVAVVFSGSKKCSDSKKTPLIENPEQPIV